jgi:hypothetical protein
MGGSTVGTLRMGGGALETTDYPAQISGAILGGGGDIWLNL